jgi:5-methylcytosine-specific restriction endonuclease McrA
MKRNYDDPAYTEFRKAVLKRDHRTCMMPGCGKKSSLQVHHIKKWSNASALRYETENGITLCKHCHNSIKGKEGHYESLFKEIINGL